MRIPGVRRARAALRSARARRRQRRTAGARLLRAFAKAYPEAFFIEIGANDGKQHDHLRELIRRGSWSGIMIEPVPYVFERLRENIGEQEGIALENVAIADRDGPLPFYYLVEASPGERRQLPAWYHGIGSFSRDVVLGHAEYIPDIERRLVRTDVPCLTFDSLCQKHGVQGIDLLLIDTEGYDYTLIQSLDVAKHHPRLLIYEHFHLSPRDREACRAHVERQGYETMEEGFDTWCLDTRVDDRLTRAWRRIRPAIPALSVHDRPE
jgi:FkbM family methyltransferase